MTRAVLPRIGFIGAGRVASALAPALVAAGYPVSAVHSRSPASARALAGRLPAAEACETAQRVVDLSDVVFITTPDAAIEAVAGALVWRDGAAAVHTSGALGLDVLAAAAGQQASVGALHPLQTFASREAPPSLDGVTFAVEAEGGLRDTLLAMVVALGGYAIELTAQDRALYHAAAVLASNYTVVLTKLATDLWLRLGAERPAALRALLPLLRGAVDNLEGLGLPAALTGPVARGDLDTVRRHLDALAEAAPDVLPAYRELALQTLPVALAQGGIDDAAAAELRRLLEARTLEAPGL